jgi:hypothetical protein
MQTFSGHDESYNPPPEYLPTEDEVRSVALSVVIFVGICTCLYVQYRN